MKLIWTLSALLTLACCFAEDGKVAPGSIDGEVFTGSVDGQRAMAPAAHVSLRGPVTRETASDATGRYRFELVPPGRYQAEATAPGLSGTVTLDIAAGETVAAPIPLELTAVTSSVTVTGTDSGVPAASAQSTAITQSTVDNAPNQNERFDSLLPLVPGVVRDPTGTSI